MKRILDRSFRYYNSANTDIRRTIRAEQRRLEEEREARERSEAETKDMVIDLTEVRSRKPA